MNMHGDYRLAKAQQERLRHLADEASVPRKPGIIAALWRMFTERLTSRARHKARDDRSEVQRGRHPAAGRQ